MKTFIKVVFVLAGIFSLAYGEQSIDSQIQAIQDAPASQKVQMMNALKVRLSKMNSQDRSDAVTQLRTQMRSQNQTQQQTQSQSAQADNQQQMQGMQQMNQKQAGTQYMDNNLVQGTRQDTQQGVVPDTGSIMQFGRP